MNSALIRRFATVAALVGALSVPLAVQAGDDHHRRSAEPAIPAEGIAQILTFDGYHSIRSIELEHGAYQVTALDPQGRPVRLSVDPDTGAYRPAGHQSAQVEPPAGSFQVARLTAPSGTNPYAEAMWPSGRF